MIVDIRLRRELGRHASGVVPFERKCYHLLDQEEDLLLARHTHALASLSQQVRIANVKSITWQASVRSASRGKSLGMAGVGAACGVADISIVSLREACFSYFPVWSGCPVDAKRNTLLHVLAIRHRCVMHRSCC